MSFVTELRAKAREKRNGGPGMKRCSSCGESKPEEAFYRQRHWPASHCKACRKIARVTKMISGVVAFILLGSPAAAAEAPRIITGTATAVDGDTLKLGEYRIRLKGIAAPEMREAGGPAAKAFLQGLTYGTILLCELTGEKTWDRHVAFCTMGDIDIGKAIIEMHYARPCVRYSNRYAALEDEAHAVLPLPAYCLPR